LILKCDSIIPGGKEISSQAAALDIFPTVLDFAGCRKPSILEGLSLYSSIIEGKTLLSKERPIYIENNDRANRGEGKDRKGWRVGLRLAGKKFIYYPSTGYRELFDITSDPGEIENIAEVSEETEKLEKMVKGFIRKRPHGYYLVFTGSSSGQTIEGELSVDGEIIRIFCEGGKELESSKSSSGEIVRFNVPPGRADEYIVGFDVQPDDARITLDIKVDGNSNPASVFLGDSRRNPESLPWQFDDSRITVADPYSLTSSSKVGCHVCKISSPFLIDREARGGIKATTAEESQLGKRVDGSGVFVMDEEEKRRTEQLRERLKALGYIQ